ncbi:hypothetical protein ACIGXF_29350 [Streptomyces sp. NPDC053086]|uniref:hypothetical protein n=1 Tax=unclassified Streptomyces TaxID=2593676 RepID=UPI0037D5F751
MRPRRARLVDARVTVAEVLAEPACKVAESAGSAIWQARPCRRRAEGMAVSVLAPDYQRIVSVLESEAGREGIRSQAQSRVDAYQRFASSLGASPGSNLYC